MKMNAIVMAGDVLQPDDKLFAYAGGGSKALIDIAGKPMVQWVLDALDNADNIDRVIAIGLSPESGVTCKKPLHFVSNQGRMLANIVAGVNKSIELDPKSEYVMIVSSDIPSVKGDMMDWLIKAATETKDDLYYGVCPRSVMEARFPTSNRTYAKLKDMEVCGSDMNVIHVSMATEHLHIWEELIGQRKSPLRQAAVIGVDTLVKLAFRQITLQALVKRVSQRIGIKGRAIVWDRAEPCMDVDKPHQLELMRKEMEKQKRGGQKTPYGKDAGQDACKDAGKDADKDAGRDGFREEGKIKTAFRNFFELDARLSQQVRVAEKPGFLRSLAIFFAHSGDSWFWITVLIVAWLFGSPEWRKWETVEFFGISGLSAVVVTIKYLVKRKRPDGDWGQIYRNTDLHSFPSGHAARAFLIALVGSALAPPWLAAALWAWAPPAALARAAMGVHYLSDVIAGAILGVLVAWLGLQFYPYLIGWFFELTAFRFW